MYTIIFDNGSQMPVSADDIYRLAWDQTFKVTNAHTNGAQTQFTADVEIANTVQTWQIVANTRSDGEQDLYANLGRNA